MTLQEAKEYLQRMEEKRAKDEKHNKRAYRDARDLSALVSIVEHGNPIVASAALQILKRF